VDVVLIRINAPGNGEKYLIETDEQFADGRKRSTNRMPGTKKFPHENARQTAERIKVEMLDVGSSEIIFDFNGTEVFEEEHMSPSYPGMFTVYRKEIVEGHLEAAEGVGPERFDETCEWNKKDATGNTKFFHWMTPEVCDEKKIQYKRPDDDDETSALVHAPIGLDEENLTTYLKNYKVDIEAFGKDKAKTLEEFASELMKGDSSLMHANNGSIVRVVDVVLLKLFNKETGKILVQVSQKYPDGQAVSLNRLPGTKRRPDENHFLTARTIVQRHLQINDNHVMCNAKEVQSVEEEKTSLAYPGLRTVYRKRIVRAELTRD